MTKKHKKKPKSNKTNSRSSKSENFNLSSKKSEISIPENTSSINDFDKIEYFEGIVSKQLNLYIWCEQKVNTLATINAIMLTAATLFVEYTKSSMSSQKDDVSNIENLEGNFHIIMILIIVLPIFISLGITLWHVIPKMRSGANPKTVHIHRSVSGIHSFNDFQEYKNHLSNLSRNDIYNDIIRQIYGMNKNIWKNQISIKWAVRFDLVGLGGFIIIIIYNFLK
jgi:hypothetical protein